MKSSNFFKLASFAIVAMTLTQSCTKDEDQITVQEESTWSVRPDFATLDTRPADVIAMSQVTEDQAFTVEFNTLKASGKYALVIGISDYQGSSSDLSYCDDDAEDWADRLEEEGYEVTSLIDTDATSAAIRSAVSDLASLSVSGNEIAFVYSGHGSNGSMISTDFSYLNYRWISRMFSSATSTKMFFTFDACQIGAMKALDADGRVVTVASNTSLYSYDGNSSMRNGVFTYYQMEAFDNLGYVYAEEDSEYAIDEMESWASSAGVSVAPSYVDSYDGDLDL